MATTGCDFSLTESEILYFVGKMTAKGDIGTVEYLHVNYLRRNENGRKYRERKQELITYAIDRLRVDGYIIVTDQGITLTERGRGIYRRLGCEC